MSNPTVMVHKQLPPRERRKIPEAMAAVQKEYDKLLKSGSWDMSGVREYSELCAEYTKKGRKCHFGMVFPLCHIKHSELAKEHQSFKGSVVYQGNHVTDNEGLQAVFSEQGSTSCSFSQVQMLD